jgi:uncharacterized protein
VIQRCPICQKAVPGEGESRPFCSPRCKDIDLGRWLDEEYRISRPMTPLEIESMAHAIANGEGAIADDPEDELE